MGSLADRPRRVGLVSGAVLRDALRAANEADVGAFIERVEAERVSLYRTHLRCTVRFVSPLLLDLLAAENVSPGVLIDAMQPPPMWPQASGARPGGPSVRRLMPRVLKSNSLGLRSADQRLARCLAYGGVLLRKPSHSAGVFGVWTSADMLHACIELGAARLAIGGGEGHLSIPNLPETLALGMPGRDLDRLVTHPLIDRRGYHVRRVSTAPDGSPLLVFGCGVQPIDLTRSAAGSAHDAC